MFAGSVVILLGLVMMAGAGYGMANAVISEYVGTMPLLGLGTWSSAWVRRSSSVDYRRPCPLPV